MVNVSHMLDDMVAAVDEGLSYDGIVSVPQAGLEDADYRTGLAESLRNGVVSPSTRFASRHKLIAARVPGSSFEDGRDHLTSGS